MKKRDTLLLNALRELSCDGSRYSQKVDAINDLASHLLLDAPSQPAAPTSGAGDECHNCGHSLRVHDAGAEGECGAQDDGDECACPGYCHEPQRDGADAEGLNGTMGRLRYWRGRAMLAEKYARIHKAVAKRYRAERDFLTGKSSHYERLFHFTADELSDLRRAAPDVTAAVEAERARVRDIWVSDNGNLRRPNIAELEEILAKTTAPARPATAVKDWPEWKRRGSGVLRELAQPATVGERKLAARWSKGVGAMATCDTCRRPRPIAYWRCPGAFTCCADCAEKAGVFATHKAAPIATPPAPCLR